MINPAIEEGAASGGGGGGGGEQEDPIEEDGEAPSAPDRLNTEGDHLIDEDFPWRTDAQDIRNFMVRRPVPTLRPPPPTRRTPKASQYWLHFARHHQLGTGPARCRSAIVHALMHRLGPLPGGLQAQSIRGQEAPGPHTATVMAFDSMGSLLAVGVNSGSVRVYDYDEYRASAGRIASRPSSGVSSNR